MEMGIEGENEWDAHQVWPGSRPRGTREEHEQPSTPSPALDALQRVAIYERDVRDARVLARLERAGLFLIRGMESFMAARLELKRARYLLRSEDELSLETCLGHRFNVACKFGDMIVRTNS